MKTLSNKVRLARLITLFLTICAFMTILTGTAFAADDGAVLYGDVDDSGSVNALDAALVLRHTVGISTIIDSAIADVDGSGNINALDAVMILKKTVGLIAAFPVEGNTTSMETKSLVVYFSWSGNTEEMANTIAEFTGSDLYALEPLNPYPEDYTACTEVALDERDSNARPAIADPLSSVSEYDVIFIGYPIWWHTAPMIVGTFLESYDLDEIDVYPFTQSASMDMEQFENSMAFIRECVGNGTVHDGLFSRYSNTSEITDYLSDNGLLK